MSRWPVETPPPEPLKPVNLAGKPPDPVTYNGPLNVFIELEGTASAYVEAATTKQAYDDIAPVPTTPIPQAPRPVIGNPISAGSAVVYNRPHVIVRRPRPRSRLLPGT
jgi:hypothetical protein